MALTSLTSLNSLTSPFAKVEILILLCAKLHNNSVISNAGIQKSLFLGIALHILHRQSLVSDMDSMHIVFHLQFNLPSSSFLLLCQFLSQPDCTFAAELTITLYS